MENGKENITMKSILIIGASNAGKSATLVEVCKRLNPSKVYRLLLYKKKDARLIELSEIKRNFNRTLIIEVNGKLILVVVGATTEQQKTITDLLEICINMKIDISFIIVSMHSVEKMDGFDTPNELKSKSEIVLTEKIYRIEDENFENNIEWKNRINRIVETLKSNI